LGAALSFISRRPRLAAFAGGLLFSLAMTLAFEPFGLWPLTLLAIIPLAVVAADREVRPARGAFFAWLGMLPFWGFVGHWVVNISNVGYIPLVWYTALTTAVGFWLLAVGARTFPRVPGWVLTPVLWTGAEVLRGNVIWNGYPWFQIGHPLIEQPVLSSPARLLGAYFVSFLVALIAGVAADLVRRRPGRWIGVGVLAGAWGASIGVAAAFSPAPSAISARIGVVQTNIPQSVKGEWDLGQRYDDHQRWLEQSLRLGERRPDVIVWPETMYPGFVLDTVSWNTIEAERDRHPALVQNIGAFRSDLLAVQSRLGVPFLIGASGYQDLRVVEIGPERDVDLKWARRFNSAMLVRNGGVESGRYDKMQLTPFGEVMPYISAWPWLERQFLTVGVGASGMNFDLSAGTDPYVFTITTRDARPLRLVTPICFEATIPAICRKLVYGAGRRRADVVVQLTNDGWFGSFDAGRLHHALCSRWRAVELGTPVVRVANTGVTCVIAADGSVARMARDQSGRPGRTEIFDVVEVPLVAGSTPYGAIGDLFGLSALGLSLLTCVIGLAKRPRGVGSSGAGASH
jgi:apolipoprotein N-acyltransferase